MEVVNNDQEGLWSVIHESVDIIILRSLRLNFFNKDTEVSYNFFNTSFSSLH